MRTGHQPGNSQQMNSADDLQHVPLMILEPTYSLKHLHTEDADHHKSPQVLEFCAETLKVRRNKIEFAWLAASRNYKEFG